MDVNRSETASQISCFSSSGQQHAAHNECYAAQNVNLWRDWLPDSVRRSLIGKHPGSSTRVDFSAGELFGSNGGQLKIDRRRFKLDPKAGRFYPKGCLSDMPGVFPQNMQPFRCVGVNNGHMDIDIAPPPVASSALACP
jgi:hypothetical protein